MGPLSLGSRMDTFFCMKKVELEASAVRKDA